MSTPLRERPDAPLGTLIFRAGLLPAETIESALEEGVKTGKRLGEILTERGLISEVELTRLLAGQKGLEFVTLREQIVDTAAASLFTEEQSRMFRAIPYAFDGDVPVVAIADPTDDTLMRDIREALGREDARFVVSPRGELADIAADVYSKPLTPAPSPEPEVEPEIESELEPETESEAEPAYVEHLNGNGTADAELLLQVPAPEIAPEPEPAPAAFEQPTVSEPSAFQVPAPEESAADEPEPEIEEPVAFEVVGWPRVEPEVAYEPEPEPAFEPEPEPAVDEPVAFEPDAPPTDTPDFVFEPSPEPTFEPETAAELETFSDPTELEHEPVAETSAHEPSDEAEPVAVPAPELDDEPFQMPTPPAPSVPVFEPVDAAEPVPLPQPEPAPPYPPAASQPVTPAEPEAPVDAPEPVVETHAVWCVTVRLTTGERVDAGDFDGEEAATREAKTIMAQVADADSGEWPFVSGRFLKPDTIISVDITELAPGEI